MYSNISAVIHCIYIVGMGIGMPAFLLQYPSRSAHTFTPLCNGNGVSCLSFSPFSPPNMNMILQLRLFINRQRYLTWQALKQVTTHHFALVKHPRKAAHLNLQARLCLWIYEQILHEVVQSSPASLESQKSAEEFSVQKNILQMFPEMNRQITHFHFNW